LITFPFVNFQVIENERFHCNDSLKHNGQKVYMTGQLRARISWLGMNDVILGKLLIFKIDEEINEKAEGARQFYRLLIKIS
jgi:hypothetical protein